MGRWWGALLAAVLLGGIALGSAGQHIARADGSTCSATDAIATDGALFGLIRGFEDTAHAARLGDGILSDLVRQMGVYRQSLSTATVPDCGASAQLAALAYMDARLNEYMAMLNGADPATVATADSTAESLFDMLAAAFHQIICAESPNSAGFGCS